MRSNEFNVATYDCNSQTQYADEAEVKNCAIFTEAVTFTLDIELCLLSFT